MSVKTQTNNNLAYGLTNALQNLSPLPKIAKRAPSATDAGEIGQLWIYNNQVWVFTSTGNWTQAAADANDGTFTSLTVNGASALNGTTVITTGNTAFTVASGTGPINIGVDAATKAITIGNTTGTTAVAINSSSSGIILNANSTGAIRLIPNATGSVAYTCTNSARVGTVNIVIPAPDIAVNDVITIVMTNTLVGLSTQMLVSLTTNDSSGGLLQIQGVVTTFQTVTISAKNVGSAAIANSTRNIVVAFMILG